LSRYYFTSAIGRATVTPHSPVSEAEPPAC
jgi:hypothetical protein